MKNGRKAIKGRCPTCGTVMFKILGGKATVAAPPARTAAPAPASPATADSKPAEPCASEPDGAGSAAPKPVDEKPENNPG